MMDSSNPRSSQEDNGSEHLTSGDSHKPKTPQLKELRDAIPPRCFKSSLTISMLYLLRDTTYLAVLVWLALQIPLIPSASLRWAAWMTYGFLQGCVGTGIWILGHECGHGGYSPYQRVNDCIGWVLHSFLLVPYFSWKITHARHHRYTGHITKDVVFVPEVEHELHADNQSRLEALLAMAEETPIITVCRLLQHQLVGWQLYLVFNVTSGKSSLPEGRENPTSGSVSHFSIASRLWLPSQKLQIAISDIGLILTLTMLYFVAKSVGFSTMALLYIVPYLWVHHWLVAITYLHHTHPDVPHYTDDAWTFTQGALGTVDRSFGFIGRHFFHEIIDYHLIHHLFPKIPFYHAEEATRAVLPLLGGTYVKAKDESFLWSLYTTFKTCNYVTESPQGGKAQPDGRLYWANTVRSSQKS